jgi:hypothetical protein
VWHEATKEVQKQGKVKMVGIILEQHPDRTRLFMQWKGMDWPILIDSFNLLESSAVPITLFIDEYGVIRSVRPGVEELDDFLNRTYPETAPPPLAGLPDFEQLKEATRKNSVGSWRVYARAVSLWGQPSQISEAIEAYQQALEKEPEHGPTNFELGVAYRKRYDSDDRQPEDFQKAVENWGQALDIDPNQYIWRRRIQQYGPRLDKPYSFYDWVTTARQEIAERGDTPAQLPVEPGGAEFAYPTESFETAEAEREDPDPRGRIFRDEKGFVKVETTVVPAAVAAGDTVRIHLVFRPNLQVKAHWNNEVEDLVFWVDPPEGWQVDNHYVTVANPPEAISQETRKVEFELRSPEKPAGSVTVPAYALYYVCEDIDGTCLYRRQDIPLQVQVSSGQ